MFNLASVTTWEGIHLAGILTEAIHTPFMQDRYQSLKSVNYVFNIARALGEEIEFKENGFVVGRARQVLDETERFLTELKAIGLMEAIARGWFANIRRAIDGGSGLDGVFKKGADYSNPVMKQLEQGGVTDE
jgi:beta-lysine 5,6-aminomutase alpha subunit